MKLKTAIIENMGLDELKQAVVDLELGHEADLRSVEGMRAVLARKGRAKPATLLQYMPEWQVKQVCEAMGRSSTGRKTALVTELLENPDSDSDETDVEEEVKRVPSLTYRKLKTTILGAMNAEYLRQVVDRLELGPEVDRRSIEDMRGVLSRKGRAKPDVLLEPMGEADVKALCEMLGQPSVGRKKALIDALLTNAGAADDDDETAAPANVTANGGGKPTKSEKEPKSWKRTEDYRHGEATRKNNPDAGLHSFDRKAPTKVKYDYDPHLDPQLVWASKAEHTSFEVPTVSLHTQERISTQAIIRAVQREPAQRSLFADPALPLTKAVKFYEHEIGWANRLILGDSLLVMNSLLHRELMAAKVQMIYFDPPYGVAYQSNFQPRIDQREVKDGKDDSLTREPEQIKAYRDTWTLGVHSYLTYLRDRFLLARDLLATSGSIFVQISDENLHHVRELLGEVFGEENFVCVINVVKTSGLSSARSLPVACDYILWYARDAEHIKFRRLFVPRNPSGEEANIYSHLELKSGDRRSMTKEERDTGRIPSGAKRYRLDNLTKPGPGSRFSFKFEGRSFDPGKRWWGTTPEGMSGLARACRLQVSGNTLTFVRFWDDFPHRVLNNLWEDMGTGGFLEEKVYVVQTRTSIVERCMLMVTDPGDLVFDPTCGSGTSAFVAEQWGRRWTTCDTSRVALALARERLMTATFPYYKLAYEAQGVSAGFQHEDVPHVTLKSIAQDLPPEAEKLYLYPIQMKGIVRVAGPFTVEAINSLDPGEALAFEPIEERARKDDISHHGNGRTSVNDHLAEMTDLLKRDGRLNVPGKGPIEIDGLGRVTGRDYVHAEGSIKLGGTTKRLGVSFGPRFGPVTAQLVEEAIRSAGGNYDALAVAGFSFDPEVLAFLDKSPAAGLQFFRVQIAPDVLVGDLLKTRAQQNLFAVIGEPQFKVQKAKDGWVVKLDGMDIYDPNANQVTKSEKEEIAAWFVDQDYDGRSFCVSQAFLPAEKGKSFEKLQRALKGQVDESAWEALSGFESRPFLAGGHKTVAVKVIDVRGNEVVGVWKFGR